MPWALQQRTTSLASPQLNMQRHTQSQPSTEQTPQSCDNNSNIRQIMAHHVDQKTASSELLALMDFATRLGSRVSITEPGIDTSDQNDVRREALLLMNLSCPTSERGARGTTLVNRPSTSTSSSTPGSNVVPHVSSFSFSCPSLSLEGVPSGLLASSAPDLLCRALQVTDRDALRLSSEAMTRNLLVSHQESIDWRIRSWAETLVSSLEAKERQLRAQGRHQRDDSLASAPEAELIVALKHIVETNSIKVESINTTFQVLEQTPKDSFQEAASSPPHKKRRKAPRNQQSIHTVTHAVSMEGKLSVYTPYGYAEINLQVPGVITGRFSSRSQQTNATPEELTGVSVELNSNMLAAMMEKSGRVIVRSTVETILQLLRSDTSSHEVPSTTNAVSNKLDNTGKHQRFTDVSPTCATLCPSHGYGDRYDHPSIPTDSDDARQALRMASPLPTHHLGATPFAHSSGGLPIVSPQVSESPPFPYHNQQSRIISKDGKGPNLPFLVEVACAAMEAH